MFQKLKTIIELAIRQQDLLLDEPIDLSTGENSPLYGIGATIDSLTLVSIIVDIEQQIHSQFGIAVHLADTAGLPPSATPFATLGTLSAYVIGRLSGALEQADSAQLASA